MIPAKHFFMIRHGESEANKKRVMAGSLDAPLTPKGRRQAAQARLIVEKLSVKPSIVIHSHLSRAKETAQIINEGLKLPMLEDPDLAEMFVGELEGRPWEECDLCLDNWQDPPGGETHQQFFARIRRAKNKILTEYPLPPLLVCHGGVFRGLWKMFGHEMPGVDNCHLHEFLPAAENQSNFPWFAHAYDDHVTRTELIYHKKK